MILAHPQNGLEKELLNLFHCSNVPMHFNKTGNKEFNNYQRISMIILLRRSGKSIRQFIDENLSESKWISWLGLKRVPKKSTLHDWMKLFSMKSIRQLFKLLIPKNVKLTAIDSTGIDSFRRSKHYEKRCSDFGDLPHMTYAKTSLLVDVDNKMILDWDFVVKGSAWEYDGMFTVVTKSPVYLMAEFWVPEDAFLSFDVSMFELHEGDKFELWMDDFLLLSVYADILGIDNWFSVSDIDLSRWAGQLRTLTFGLIAEMSGVHSSMGIRNVRIYGDTPVPEPATILLFGLGLLGLAGVSRRRK